MGMGLKPNKYGLFEKKWGVGVVFLETPFPSFLHPGTLFGKDGDPKGEKLSCQS
jgi:hypothetical protein